MNMLQGIAGAAMMVVAASAAVADPITVQIVNQSNVDPGDVYVLLTGNGASATGITPGTSTTLASLTNNSFTLSAISSGRIYFSYGAAVASNEPPTSTTRFDKVELTYPGAANLTAVDFFGIPFKLETLDASGGVLQTLTYYTSADTLSGQLAALAPGARVPASGSFLRVLSPTNAPSAFPSLQGYVNGVAGQTVTISGTYVGPVAPSPNTYSYTGTFASDGSITLAGTMSAAATPNAQPLTIAGSTLADAIYTCNGPYSVANAANNPQQVSNNDVYAAIYASLIGGFNFGYVGGNAGSNSAGWYGTTPYHPPYAAARSSADGFYNQYAAAIAQASDAYGFPFSDLLQLVQVSLNPGSTPATVATLRITILPDDVLDAPVLTTATPTSNTIALAWNAVSGATGYSVTVSPPLPGQTTSVTGTSTTLTNLQPGTPYTVSVAATNGSATSAAFPYTIATTGSPNPVTGAVTWNFIPNFTGTFPAGHTITFNGVSQPLPTTANPALQFNNVPGVPGQQNAYVFRWTDQNSDLVYQSVLYVTLDASPATGMGAIDQDPAATFLAANQNPPSYAAGVAFNLFLSIAPTIQRSVLPSAGPMPPANRPTVFARTVDAQALGDGSRVRLRGAVRDPDGIRRVTARVSGAGLRPREYATTLRRGGWTSTVRRDERRRTFRVALTVLDKAGRVARRSYRVVVR